MIEGQEVAGRYILQRLVASGPVAAVWEAEDTILSRIVAIKSLQPQLAANSAFVSSFRAETKTAARLNHQSIVAIYDSVSGDGIEAVIMELVDGITLSEFLQTNGRLSLADTAALTTQVAAALEVAHKARVVHRGINPINIILCPDRRVKVTDFGIAEAIRIGETISSRQSIGTAKYLAPEQVEGLGVDERTDIFSLGMVLYESLTGSSPLVYKHDMDRRAEDLWREPPRFREIDPLLSLRAESVVLKAIERDPTNRYATASELSQAMEDAIANPEAELARSATPTFNFTGTNPPRPQPTSEPNTSNTTTIFDPKTTEAHRYKILERPILFSLTIAGLTLGIALILAISTSQISIDWLLNNGAKETNNEVGYTSINAELENTQLDESSASQKALENLDIPSDPESLSKSALPVNTDTGLTIEDATDFDPSPGDGVERLDRINLLFDGDQTTSWISEGYDNRLFGNLKTGVGVVVTLNAEHELNRLTVISPTQGWAANVYVTNNAKTTLQEWGNPLDKQVNIDGDTSFELRGVRGRTVLLWITDLGDAPPRVHVEIAELTLS